MGVLVLNRPSSHALDYNIPSQNGNPKSEDSGVYYYYSSFVWSTWTQTPKTSAEGGKIKGKYVYVIYIYKYTRYTTTYTAPRAEQ